MLIEDTGLCYTAEAHENLPMQRINRRKINPPKNFIQNLFQKTQTEVFFLFFYYYYYQF